MTKSHADPPRQEEAFGQLWAGIVEDLRLSLPLHRAVMTVRVITAVDGEAERAKDQRVVSWYELAFEGVTKFEFSDTDANPWTVTELTEAGMRRQGDNTEYFFELSANDDVLTITCENVRVTLLQKDEVHASAVK